MEERARRQLADAAAKAEAARAAMRNEIATLADQHAAEKRELERRASDAEDRLVTVRAELADEFDAARHTIAAELRQKVCVCVCLSVCVCVSVCCLSLSLIFRSVFSFSHHVIFSLQTITTRNNKTGE